MASNDFEIPKGLSKVGRKAAHAIRRKVRAAFGKDSDGGGCRAFYTPKEWVEEKGNDYGVGSELIVVYDGGDLHPFFEFEGGNSSLIDSMTAELEKVGVWSENCTSWYSAVYKK